MNLETIPAPRPIILYLAHNMRYMLPRPLFETQEEMLRRDDAAGAVLAELAPLTVVEAEQAAIIVAGQAHAMECMRLATNAGDNARLALKCLAQSTSMFRMSEAARRRLATLQAGRAAAATDAQPAPAATPSPPPSPPLGAANVPDAGALAEAEAFARQSPRRAIQIRRLGCVPKGITYTPPRPAVIRALVSSQTPALRKLDRKVA